jgi:cytoskeletal protein CcmA (bactofilin family)
MFLNASDPTRKKGVQPNGATLVAKGATIRGEIHTGETALRVEGHFEGTIYSEGEVTIELGGTMVGTLSAHHLIVAGKAEGVFRVEGRLEIRATGNIEGEVEAASIVVDEGGVFEGSCSRPGGKPKGEAVSPKADASGSRSMDVINPVPDYSGSRVFGQKPN